jgi:hypothetical protein
MSTDSEPDLEKGVYRVSHSIVVGKSRLSAESDFIHQDGTFLLVLDWARRPQGDLWPSVTLPLDEHLLEASPGRPGYFTYSGELVDPRTVQ